LPALAAMTPRRRLVSLQRGDAVARAAHLERSGVLEVLG
jgi:hypothetical protein